MPALVVALRNNSPDVRLRILEVMIALDSTIAKQYLGRMVDDKDHAMRAYAIMRLRQLSKRKPTEPNTGLRNAADEQPKLIVQTGHRGTVGHAKFSPDGRYVQPAVMIVLQCSGCCNRQRSLSFRGLSISCAGYCLFLRWTLHRGSLFR